MRVEAVQHALDGIGQEFLVVHGIDVIGFDARVDLGEGAQLIERQRREIFFGLAVGLYHHVEGDDGAGDGAEKQDDDITCGGRLHDAWLRISCAICGQWFCIES